MAAFIKLYPKYKYLNVPEGTKHLIRPTSDLMGAKLSSRPGVLLSGSEVGKEVDEVQVRQTVKVVPEVPVRTSKFTVMLGFNPALAEVAEVTCSPILEPGQEIALVLRAYKNFTLSEFDYIFTVYMID